MTDSTRLRSDLRRLAGNLRWTWDRATREVFAQVRDAAGLAEGTHPWQLVASLDDATLDGLASNDHLVHRVARRVADLDHALTTTDTWFHTSGGDPSQRVAYLCAEFALADALAIYSGGLGVLAGDHLRSASDLGIPMVAVGLAYRDGYFRQLVDPAGHQHAEAAPNDLPGVGARPVVGDDGDRITVEVPSGDGPILVQGWQVDVGRVPLLLLDTDVAGNEGPQRAITRQLYGGDQTTRLLQELVLGLGGPRVLEAAGLSPDVIHLNEGHAAFAGLQRLAAHRDAGCSFAEARAAVREELVFTTHTPVPAGHDAFGYDLARHHLQPMADRLGIAFEGLWELAEDGASGRWNQTVLCLRLAGQANGVARLHGEVSRRMWSGLWADRPADEVPISHVTNGVHPGTWVGPDVAGLLDDHLGPTWRDEVTPARFDRVRDLDPGLLWAAKRSARAALIDTVRRRLAAQVARPGTVGHGGDPGSVGHGGDPGSVGHGADPGGERSAPDGSGLDPDALTIGFARRFATYKRGTLVLRDLDRLGALLADDDRPVQLVMAGKAHPADVAGQHLIAEIVARSRDARLAGRLVFVEGYDLDLASHLVAGCDVWLNTPRRPNEASGTSGMKAAMNGGLNLSIADGWWDEAVQDLGGLSDAGFGWVIGDGSDHETDAQDDADADHLYRLLEQDVVPTFFDRDEHGLPRRWLAMATESIRLLTPRFSAHRMVRDYDHRYRSSTERRVRV